MSNVNIMDYVNLLDTVFAFVLQFIVAYLVRKSYKSEVKGLIALGISVAFALVRTFLEGKFDGGNIVAAIAYVSAMSEMFYLKFGKRFSAYIEENYGNTDQKPEPLPELHPEPANPEQEVQTKFEF